MECIRRCVLSLTLVLAGCANSPMAVPGNYFAKIEPVVYRVDIPRSYLKDMRVYLHPSMTRAFVAPTKNDASAEWLAMGVANWSARASEMMPAYRAALRVALKDAGHDCEISSPVAYADTLAFEFSLTCKSPDER